MFENGFTNTTVVSGWTYPYSGGISSPNIYGTKGTTNMCAIATSNKIDVTKYNKLRFIVTNIANYSDQKVSAGVTSNINTSYSADIIGYKDPVKPAHNLGEYYSNISSATGEYYIVIAIGGRGSSTAYISKIWLEM